MTENSVFPAAMDVLTACLAPEDELGLALRVAAVHVTLCLPVTRLDDLTPTQHGKPRDSMSKQWALFK